MNNQVPASFAGCIGKMNTPANVLTTGRAPAAAGKTTYAEPTCAEYEAMLDGTTPSPTFNQALAVAHSYLQFACDAIAWLFQPMKFLTHASVPTCSPTRHPTPWHAASLKSAFADMTSANNETDKTYSASTAIGQASTLSPCTPTLAKSISTSPKPVPKSIFAAIRQMSCIKWQCSLPNTGRSVQEDHVTQTTALRKQTTHTKSKIFQTYFWIKSPNQTLSLVTLCSSSNR